MKTKTIIVTQRHIDRANKMIKDNNPTSKVCPVSLAVRRAFKRSDVHTFYAHSYVGYMTLRLPSKVKHFIEQFDSRQPVEPFSFKVSY
jgi:hypothetical protein